MGQEIDKSGFTESEHIEFRARLREETKTLKRWFDERAFEYSERLTTGLEREAWLIDKDCLPAPANEEFLAAVDDPAVVPELSKFNFELNSEPQPLAGDFLSDTQTALEALWGKCQAAANGMELSALAIGILPTVRDEMLQPAWMSRSERYRALNEELFRQRKGELLHINIAGFDALDYRCDHVMLEAACTSFQAHLRVNQEEAVRFYNASIMAAGPIVAATANSPFLYGKDLWAETRIPAFEQSTAVHSYLDVQGRQVLRVTLGGRYLRRSLFEAFLENLSYPALLPALDDRGHDTLQHLRLQNGTIWRWNRPIIGFNKSGAPHLRIEHRVMPAGPSITDEIANLALCLGLTLALGRAAQPLEEALPFEDAWANFYACAKEGLLAQVRWNGRAVNVQQLLLDVLLDDAKRALVREGAREAMLDHYFERVLRPRLRSGRTGAEWQRSFVDCNGPRFQALTERYLELQNRGDPVHTWTV